MACQSVTGQHSPEERCRGNREPGEVGCVGAVAGSQGLEEVERRG